ncbi:MULTISPECIES: flagellar hook-length control protein FliK [Rhizobium]|uniref:flagellar hook-length control protein FliK n=1 Tax=Rhizobium TaxID=379 RepID=UPI00195855B7|nr:MULTISPECIES: flagellar hook-length control protein FliK [Rhizobium]MBM7044634.1 flagellar hook-length control protein FliK [Rhizobium lusitanum]
MNDIGISGASSGVDVLASAKGARPGKQDDGKGFLDALTGSLGNGRNTSGTSAGTDANAAADMNEDTDTDTGKAASGDKAPDALASSALAVDESIDAGAGMIDTSAANLANLAGLPKGAKLAQGAGTATLSKSLIELQKAAAADASAGSATDPAAATTDQAMPSSEAGEAGKVPVQPKSLDQLADIAQQLVEVATAVDQPAPGEGDGKTPVVKGGKGTSTTDDGKSSVTQGAHTAGTISDALSLLNAPQTVAAAQAVAVPNGQATGDTKVQGAVLGKAALTQDSSDNTAALPSDGNEADTAQTFRVARADGRGGSLDMSITKNGDDAADVNVAASANGDGQSVTVLDSRRYLGLTASPNSALVAGSLAGDREWSAAMQPGSALSNAASQTSTGKVVNTLKIQLRPDNLGDVTATMRLSGDQLSVDLKVQTGEAYRQLHADQSRMVDALRAQGYQVDSITVTMASNADQQSDTGSRQSGSGQSQQQSLLNQGQGGDARPKGQNYSGQQANGNNGNRSSGERGVEDGAAGNALRSRSGAVYL